MVQDVVFLLNYEALKNDGIGQALKQRGILIALI